MVNFSKIFLYTLGTSWVSHHCCDPCRRCRATQCRAHGVAANSRNFRDVTGVSRTFPLPTRRPCRTYLATPLSLRRGESCLNKCIALHRGVALHRIVCFRARSYLVPPAIWENCDRNAAWQCREITDNSQTLTLGPLPESFAWHPRTSEKSLQERYSREAGCNIVLFWGLLQRWNCLGDLKITSTSTERQKRGHNLAPVLVTISGRSLVFSRKDTTSTGFIHRRCAQRVSTSSGKKSVSPRKLPMPDSLLNKPWLFWSCVPRRFCFRILRRPFSRSLRGHT